MENWKGRKNVVLNKYHLKGTDENRCYMTKDDREIQTIFRQIAKEEVIEKGNRA